MEDQEPVAEVSNQGEKVHERSASYPALTLDEAIDFAHSKVYKNFTNTIVKREEVARTMDVHASTLARHFAACAQFGLFIKDVNGYKVSPLFDRIINPENAKDKKLAKIEAFNSPKIYKEIIAKFDGRLIEPEFPNTLTKHHNITKKAAPEAADTFIKSARQAEVMGENRVLKYQDTLGATQKITGYAEIIEEDKMPESNGDSKTDILLINKDGKNIPIPTNKNLKTVPIHLTKDKEAYFAYPGNMSANDVKLVEHQLAGILMRIQFENDEMNKENE